MKLAEIKDGTVANIILVDPENIPDWCADWPDATGAEIGWTWDGQTYTEPEASEASEVSEAS